MEVLTQCRCTNHKIVYKNKSPGIEVYTADHPIYGAVAIKILDCGSENSLHFYQKEGRIAGGLEHPSICKVFEEAYVQTNRSGYKYYIIMEKADSDLYGEIKKRNQKPVPWTEKCVFNMLEQAVSALAFAQQESVCHRDIKPQNILIWQNGRVKLADFGSANECIEKSEVQTLTLQGTPMYLSPELREYYSTPERQRPRNPRYNPYKSDVYSLALTLLYLLQLSPPCALTRLEDLQEATRKQVADLRVSDTMKEILTSMLACDESMRPDCIMMKQLLDDLLNGGLSKQRVEPLPDNYLLATGEVIRAEPVSPQPPIRAPQEMPPSDVLTPPNVSVPWVSPTSVFRITEESKQVSSAVHFVIDEAAPSLKAKKPKGLGSGHPSNIIEETLSDHIAPNPEEIFRQPSIVYESFSQPIVQELEVAQEPQSAQQNCVICHKELLDGSGKELECGHCYCAPDCLEVFMLNRLKYFRADTESLTCPVQSCGRNISKEYLETLRFQDDMSIRSYIHTKQIEEICMECRHKREVRTLKCTHKFCHICMEGWKVVAKYSETQLLACSICRVPLSLWDTQYLAHMLSRKK
jgi:serine/threonine protein kinase